MFPRNGRKNTPWIKAQAELALSSKQGDANLAAGSETEWGFMKRAVPAPPGFWEICLCKDKAGRCKVPASLWTPVWSFGLPDQLYAVKSLVKLNMRQSPKQWSAKGQFELAGVHAAVMKQEGKKRWHQGKGKFCSWHLRHWKNIAGGRERKMNILIFITHKRSTISEARVWEQVSVCALVLFVILVFPEVSKFRQIHLQGTNEFMTQNRVKENLLKQTEFNGKTIGWGRTGDD